MGESAQGAVSFPDHFSAVSDAYAAFRPRYPEALFDWLAEVAPRRSLVWDCATGTGQAARPLAQRFARVVATDASAKQISSAEPHPRIEFRVASAERSGLMEGSVDLVTAAQAVHWFDRPAFFAEVRRVSRPGAVLAIWTYSALRVESPSIQRILDDYYHRVVGAYWPPQRKMVEDGYRSLDFPFEEIPVPELEIAANLTLDALAGYVGTWSATQAYREARGEDPLPALVKELGAHWRPMQEIPVRWPLAIRAGRIDSGASSTETAT